MNTSHQDNLWRSFPRIALKFEEPFASEEACCGPANLSEGDRHGVGRYAPWAAEGRQAGREPARAVRCPRCSSVLRREPKSPRSSSRRRRARESVIAQTGGGQSRTRPPQIRPARSPNVRRAGRSR